MIRAGSVDGRLVDETTDALQFARVLIRRSDARHRLDRNAGRHAFRRCDEHECELHFELQDVGAWLQQCLQFITVLLFVLATGRGRETARRCLRSRTTSGASCVG
jgi:hypothetical protein